MMDLPATDSNNPPRLYRLMLSLLVGLLLGACASQPAPQSGHGFAGASGPAWAMAPAQGLTAPQQRLRTRLHAYYRQWAGVPYEYGGTSRNGIDCSAFVQQTLATVKGVRLPRTTRRQARRGRRIAPAQLRIGDLVFFRIAGGRHVGIYIGNGRFMHASSSEGVTISRLDNIYWRRHFWQARRVQLR